MKGENSGKYTVSGLLNKPVHSAKQNKLYVDEATCAVIHLHYDKIQARKTEKKKHITAISEPGWLTTPSEGEKSPFAQA